jgi:WS/DGAT/MGAT family acyltransferase
MHQVVTHVPFARPEWDDDPTFDIAAHVHQVRVPTPGTRAELDAVCCELQMDLLDRSRPLWEMWFVDGLADGRVGLVYKVHHAVVDGVSAAETFEVLLDRRPQPTSQQPQAAPASQVSRLAGALVDDALTTTQLWVATGVKVATRPAIAAGAAVELARLVTGSLVAPHASLNGRVGDRRRLVPVTFDLAQLKAVGRRYDATVNDVVLTLVGAGLGELFAGRGEQIDHVRVLVPVSLRDETRHDGVGNRVAALMVTLATERDPIAALPAVVAEMHSRKAGPEAATLDLLLRSVDCWPIGLFAPVSRHVVHRQPFVNLVVTNVRGAEQQLSLLGSKIVEIVPVVPLGGNLGLGIAVLSYAGQLVIGLHADADAFPDLDLVADAMQIAFATLEKGRR